VIPFFKCFVPNPEKEIECAKSVIVRKDNAMTKQKEDTGQAMVYCIVGLCRQ
jgi:hypothetical protein